MKKATATLLAPTAGAHFLTRVGTTYTADARGVVRNVLVGTDTQDLVASGCILVQPGRFPIFVLKGAKLDSTDDQPFNGSQLGPVNQYMIDKVVVTNPSVELNASGAIYTQPGKQGDPIAQVAFSGLKEPTDSVVVRAEGSVADKIQTGNLYLTLETAQQGDKAKGATADVYVFGDVISI